MLKAPTKRRGRMIRGKRMSSARNEERQIVPNSVVIACTKAAITIALEVGEGSAFLWKYHCDTVAAVVARWIPLMTESVQIYITIKKTPSHQVDASMTKKLPDFEGSPPRKTLVNMPSHAHVQAITATRVANP